MIVHLLCFYRLRGVGPSAWRVVLFFLSSPERMLCGMQFDFSKTGLTVGIRAGRFIRTYTLKGST